MTTPLDLPRFTGSARCAEVDPDVWFPEKGGDNGRTAKKVCGSCEMQVECLQWALDNDERYGVWGGLSERERRRLRSHQATTPQRSSLDLELSQSGNHDPHLGALRRAEVERLTTQGLSAQEIADQLRVTRRSVIRHRTAARRSAEPAA